MRFAANRPFPLTESPLVGGVHAATLPPSSPPTRNTHEDGFNFASGGRERLHISQAARVNCSTAAFRREEDMRRRSCLGPDGQLWRIHRRRDAATQSWITDPLSSGRSKPNWEGRNKKWTHQNLSKEMTDTRLLPGRPPRGLPSERRAKISGIGSQILNIINGLQNSSTNCQGSLKIGRCGINLNTEQLAAHAMWTRIGCKRFKLCQVNRINRGYTKKWENIHRQYSMDWKSVNQEHGTLEKSSVIHNQFQTISRLEEIFQDATGMDDHKNFITDVQTRSSEMMNSSYQR